MRSTDSGIKRLTEPVPSTPSWGRDSRRVSDDPRWQLAQRIAASGSLGRSHLLSGFLLYVCDRHLRGKGSEITEQQIGVHVFGRREGYSSDEDNIVRNYARILRKRLEEYFTTEGVDEALQVKIPRGGYVPVFSPRGSDTQPEEGAVPAMEREPSQIFAVPAAPALPAQTVIHSPDISAAFNVQEGVAEPQPLSAVATDAGLAKSSRLHAPLRLSWPAALLIVLCAVVITTIVTGYLFAHTQGALRKAVPPAMEQKQAGNPLWVQMFRSGHDTVVVPPDSGLTIMEGLTQRPVSLADYVSGNYHTESPTSSRLDAHIIQDIGTRPYTSILVLDFVAHLFQLKEVVPEHLLIRDAHDLHMGDLRSGNTILLGSADSNPWVELFQQQLNFGFSYNPKNLDAAPIILNRHPLAGERGAYFENDLNEPLHNTYGLIAYMPNLDGTGHVLLVEGIDMAGTQAAGAFLLNPSLMSPVLARAADSNSAIRPFELLIETGNVAADASRLRLVSERISPAS
jgi:hypothetical protein